MRLVGKRHSYFFLSVGLKRLEGVSEVGAILIGNGCICHGCFIRWFEKVGRRVRGWGNFNRESRHMSRLFYQLVGKGWKVCQKLGQF